MEKANHFSNFEYPNKKGKDDKLKLSNFRVDIKKVFSIKLKSKLHNNNNSQLLKFLKPSTDSKNSQTLIKKYDYDLNKVLKSNSNFTEPLNSISNLKNSSSKDLFPYKLGEIHNKIKSRFFFRKSNSYKTIKLYNSLDYKEKEVNPFSIKHNKFKLGKKIIKKNLSQDSYKGHKNLEKIGKDFLNYTNTNYSKNNKDSINNSENKKENHINNITNKNTTSCVNLLNNFIINNTKKVHKKTYLRNNILSLKHYNNNFLTKSNLFFSKEKKVNWKNKILNDVIININKNIFGNALSKNVYSMENNYRYLQKIKISTLINVNNVNNINNDNPSNNNKFKSL